MEDDIKVFGLSNGMEIIGTFVSEDDRTIKLKNALAINLQQIPNATEYQVNLIPPTFFAQIEENGRRGIDLDLYKNVILFTYELKEDIKQRYTLQTGKIIIAAGSLPKH